MTLFLKAQIFGLAFVVFIQITPQKKRPEGFPTERFKMNIRLELQSDFCLGSI